MTATTPTMHVAQVRLDESGGGPRHVELLVQGLSDDVSTDVTVLSPADVRIDPFGWRRALRQLDVSLPASTQIVHAHGVRAALAAGMFARRRGLPLVVTVHGLHSIRRSAGFRLRAAAFLNRKILERASAVIAISESDRDYITESLGVADDRVHLIRAAFDPPVTPPRSTARSQLDIPTTAKVIVWIARFDEQKDPRTFVRIAALLEGRDDFVCLMVGDGPLYDTVGREAARNAPNLRLLGWRDDVGSLLAAADIFVSTSRWEGLPIAAMEAASTGLALVVSEAPGNSDLATFGLPCQFFPVGDERSAVARLTELLEAEERRADLATRAREAVMSTFNRGNMCNDVVRVYRLVVEQA